MAKKGEKAKAEFRWLAKFWEVLLAQGSSLCPGVQDCGCGRKLRL